MKRYVSRWVRRWHRSRGHAQSNVNVRTNLYTPGLLTTVIYCSCDKAWIA